jgi:hypothetical protein
LKERRNREEGANKDKKEEKEKEMWNDGMRAPETKERALEKQERALKKKERALRALEKKERALKKKERALRALEKKERSDACQSEWMEKKKKGLSMHLPFNARSVLESETLCRHMHWQSTDVTYFDNQPFSFFDWKRKIEIGN